MSEPTQNEYRVIEKIFIEKYNDNSDTNFVLEEICDEKNDEDYDLLYRDGDKVLKVQHIEATPCTDDEVGRVKRFERQELHELPVMNLQEDYWRVRKSVGHKSNTKYSTENELVLLLDFGLMCWDEKSLNSMRKACFDEKNEFKDIYCIHVGKNMCEKLKGMISRELYKKLDSDFITPEMSDEWVRYMDAVADYLCDNFKERDMGLVCDFSKEITRVYSAVFPSQEVMQKILDDGVEDALLFTHHPSIWDIRRPEIFYLMDRDLLEEFKKRRISIYTLHVSLDAYGEYSTSATLAKALDLEIEKPFSPYHGILAGVIGKTTVKTVKELQNKYSEVVGHDVSLYQYGDENIKDGRVAVVAGGGNDMDVVQDVLKKGVNTLVTGVTAKNEFSQEVHEFEEENNINLLGGTHYSTEKFACIAMCDYFKNLGLPVEFISDEPVLEDM